MHEAVNDEELLGAVPVYIPSTMLYKYQCLYQEMYEVKFWKDENTGS